MQRAEGVRAREMARMKMRAKLSPTARPGVAGEPLPSEFTMLVAFQAVPPYPSRRGQIRATALDKAPGGEKGERAPNLVSNLAATSTWRPGSLQARGGHPE